MIKVTPKGGWTLGAILAVAATAITLWNTLDPWPMFGWTTPNQHNADFAEVDDFRTEWRCSEWAEDLEDLYGLVNAGDDSQQLQDRIERLRKRMDENKCERWEDY